jgi:transcriptional regulator with XRE-family HTH domain
METTKIKLERLQLGISQSKMAERLGVGLRCYQYYESGERQIPKHVIMLHQALKRNAILEKNEKYYLERTKM